MGIEERYPKKTAIEKTFSFIYLCAMLKQVLVEATKAGAAKLLHFFNGNFKISQKAGINNFVTEADIAAEKAIIEVVRSRFPNHSFLGEEGGEQISADTYKWIIDPIDGTTNFAHGIPLCCVSVAVEEAGEVIMGAVYNPLMNEFYFAEKDKGAFLNDAKISVSKTTEFSKSCLVTGFPYQLPEEQYINDKKIHAPLEVFNTLIKQGMPVRRLGSAALDLCWVAAGRFDGFYEHNLNAWDTAAGFLLVKEAGGLVTDFFGEAYNPYKLQIVATNGHIHEKLLTYLKD